MMTIEYMIDRKPEGVKSIILSSTLRSNKQWAAEQHKRIRQFMSPEDQAAIAKAEETGDYSDPAYIAANDRYMEKYCAGKPSPDDPECLRRPKKSGTESYLVAWGLNEYTPTGTLKDYEYTDRLHEIKVPALIINGSSDLCAPEVAKTMADLIPVSKWKMFEGSRHMCFVERNAEYIDLLNKWLDEAEQ